MTYTVEHLPEHGSSILRFPEVRDGWEQWFLLSSDQHIDSKLCREDMFKRHLEQARERNAGIFMFGDLFDAMCGRADRRGGKSLTRPEFLGDNYLNLLLQHAIGLLGPYADRIIVIGQGNHETTPMEREEFDLLEGLTSWLNQRDGVDIRYGDYCGWIRFQFQIDGTRRTGRTMFWHHGSGGGSWRSKGILNADRRQLAYDADWYVTGHLHQSTDHEVVQVGINSHGREITREIKHVQLPSYQDLMLAKRQGWGIRKGMTPGPVGAKWMRLTYTSREGLQMHTENAR
jgi:hypothetical protein